jgi:transaldolase
MTETKNSRLHELSRHGVSVWIDSLSREMLEDGELARLMAEDAVVGVTSNPTIFQKALAEGDSYDAQLQEVAAGTDDAAEIFFALAQDDIRAACDLMRAVWDASEGVDGWVSLEVDPTLAYDRERTYEQAMRFHREIERPNLYVKIPATEPGLGAIEDCIAKGRSINVTLIFSLDRYAAVVESYLRGLERLVASGGDPGTVLSVASFFVSRVDSEADRRLDEAGRDDLQGLLAIANAKLAYQRYLAEFSGPRWEFLAAKGARPQRCLWASTSTKNPAYRDVLYVEELIGPDTVNTMPLETCVPSPTTARSGREASPRGSRTLGSFSPTSRPQGSTTTTSSARSRRKAWRSSPTRSRSFSTGSGPRWARWRRRERRDEPATRGPARAAAARLVRGRHLRCVR